MGYVARWLDERVGLTDVRETLLDRKVPARLTWWHTLGSATLAVFLVQMATGTVLGMYYAPSPDHAYNSLQYIESQVVSGAVVRGIHHWGASAMVILVFAHMIRVFTMGAYKYPREANWLLGVGLFLVVMGFGFTGYLLPWDQKAYWATVVGTNMAGTTPIIGDALLKLMRGGTELGAATLTRFYAVHVLLLPAAFMGLVGLHLVLVIRQGIAARAVEMEEEAPETTDHQSYPAFYRTRYARSKAGDVRFWPDIIAKDAVVAGVVVVALVLLGTLAPAKLEPPADPSDTTYVPRPEWYFLPLFQLLKLVPGEFEAAAAVGIPAGLLLALVVLPFADRRSTRTFARRPFARAALMTALGGSSLLIGASVKEDAARESPAPEAGRPLTSVERSGRALFKQQRCGGCHAIQGDAAAAKTEDAPDAPDLTEVGLRHSAAWVHSFLENPTAFHPDSKMPAYGPPTLSHQEIEELSRYVATLRGPEGWSRQPEFRDTFPEPVKPRTDQ